MTHLFPFTKKNYLLNGSVFVSTLVVVLVDLRLPHITLTPIFSLLIIGILALRQAPPDLFKWILLLMSASLAMLYVDRHNGSIPEGQTMRLFLRCALVFVGCITAFGLCIYRSRVETSYQQVLDVLKKMPAAVIVSDGAGDIILVNDKAVLLLDRTEKEMVGSSYFSHIILGPNKGTSIQKYLSILQPATGETAELDIFLKNSNKKIFATLTALRLTEKTRESWLLTTI